MKFAILLIVVALASEAHAAVQIVSVKSTPKPVAAVIAPTPRASSACANGQCGPAKARGFFQRLLNR